MKTKTKAILLGLMILVFGAATSASAMGCGVFGSGLGFAGGHGLWGGGHGWWGGGHGFGRGYGLWGNGYGLLGTSYTYAGYPYGYYGCRTGKVYSYRRYYPRRHAFSVKGKCWKGWRRGRYVRICVFR
jgi:hypothetical protein